MEHRRTDSAKLRRLAEERLRQREGPSPERRDADLRRLVTELQVHQIELELQNEELQQARDEVEAGLRRYTDLYDFAPVSYFTLDAAGGIVEANLTGAGLLGKARSRLIGRRLAAFVADESLADFNAFRARVFTSHVKEVCDVVLSGNADRPIHVRVEALVAEDGRSCRAVVLDITDRKQAEALLAVRHKDEQARLAAEEANAAKDRFLAMLSHELRTPLTPVVAAMCMLQKQPQFDEHTREILQMVHRNVNLEARLIDDLLDLTRITRGKIELNRQPVDVRDVVRRTLEVCQADLEARGVKLEVELSEAPCLVEADVARLQQVFWNLLKNGIKFTPSDGRVRITCRPDQQSRVVVEVIDTGVGIEPEAMSRIFNAFEQAEQSRTRQFGGLGLGLTISKSLVELHGGAIEVHSRGRSKGATFTVTLPLVSGPNASEPVDAASPGTQQAPKKTASNRHRLLLVEDHSDTVEMLEAILSSEGYMVHRAGDVASALELAAREAFDLLLSDLGLPDGSGIELMRELRRRGSKLPGIALSGYGQDHDVRQSLEAGFAAHVLKPVDIDRLLNVLQDVACRRSDNVDAPAT